ncbi:unnamed protein product [Soboliphyme baturini]|uniref:Indigoidine synthase A like protein n=1 Tax=Soboliphyme baturini TaxID=241478 RepID=A0A183IG40_9BILA|nr:unnamed protein product [Soboliphyme baturini]
MPFPENLKLLRTRNYRVDAWRCHFLCFAIRPSSGACCIGMTKQQLQQLAETGDSCKVSLRDICLTLHARRFGGTTVAATTFIAHKVGIKVFVTGGIGGIHRDVTESKCPILVVCSGIKTILDIPKTLEYCETLGIPVITFGPTNDFPGFWTEKSGYHSQFCTENPQEISELMSKHFMISAVLYLSLQNAVLNECHCVRYGIITVLFIACNRTINWQVFQRRLLYRLFVVLQPVC